MFRLYLHKSSLVNNDVHTTFLFKDNFELTRQNDEQTVLPVKNFIGINNNLLSGKKTFRFSCERRHKHTVFAHASLLLKAIKLSQIARLFQSKKKRRYTISIQMADEINLKRKSTFQNTIYLPVASSLV